RYREIRRRAVFGTPAAAQPPGSGGNQPDGQEHQPRGHRTHRLHQAAETGGEAGVVAVERYLEEESHWYQDSSAAPRVECRAATDGEGFEPSIPLRVCRFSRPVPSTTRTPVLG